MAETANTDGFETFWVQGSTVTLLRTDQQTGGSYCLLEVVAPPGRSSVPHMHMLEWEAVYLLSGTIKVEAPGVSQLLRPGELAAFPPGVPHRLSNPTGVESRSLVVCTPAGFDDFIREIGDPVYPTPGHATPGHATAGSLTSFRAARSVTAEPVDPGLPFRIRAAAPRHGITLLPDEALTGDYRIPVLATPDTFDIDGVHVRVLQELGVKPGDPALLYATFPPAAVMAVHGQPGPQLYYVTAGLLELRRGRASDAPWTGLEPGTFGAMPPLKPYTLRNAGGPTTEAFVVTTKAVLNDMRTTSRLASNPEIRHRGASTHQFMASAILHAPETAGQRACWTTSSEDNAETDLNVGHGLPRSRLN